MPSPPRFHRTFRAQMPAAVLCQGLAVRGTFPNLFAEFAPAQTTFSKALWPFPNLFGTSSEKKIGSNFTSIWCLCFCPIHLFRAFLVKTFHEDCSTTDPVSAICTVVIS